jgi:hypothetical protein
MLIQVTLLLVKLLLEQVLTVQLLQQLVTSKVNSCMDFLKAAAMRIHWLVLMKFLFKSVFATPVVIVAVIHQELEDKD